MRNLPIPIDTTRLTFVCVSAPRPRLLDQNTGEVKVDKNGHTVYTVGVSAAGENGRVELLTVNVSGEPRVAVGQIVEPVDLVGFAWEQTRDGELRWGISYRAAQIVPATSPATGPAVDAAALTSTAPSSAASLSPSAEAA